MKKAIITKISKGAYVNFACEKDPVQIEASGEELEVSDGYHTMDELYDHRITLYIALCRTYQRRDQHMENELGTAQSVTCVWRSKLHSDGTAFDGWFILGIDQEKGYQITYHLPLDRWDETEFAKTLDKAPEWDGHTSADVLARLKQL